MKAHELLAKPEHWTKGHMARLAYLTPVNVGHPQAVCFCAIGALARCYNGGTVEGVSRYVRVRSELRERVRQLGFSGIIDWDDDGVRTHEEVLAVLKELDI